MYRTIITGDKAKNHHPAAVRLVVHHYGDGDEWSRYLILDRSECLQIYHAARKAGASRWDALVEATCPFWTETYRGPGRFFSSRPYTVRNGRRWRVVYQRGGLDV